MVDKGLAGRVADLEAKVGRKSLEEQFRAQAEMLDERFVEVHERLDGLAADVGVLKIDVSALKTDVSALKKDMAIVRGGMGIILRKLR